MYCGGINVPMLIMYGPTGVGKSDLALEIAARIPAEIINMDVGQFYEPFCIGTAKPRWKDSIVRHHIFDILTEPTSCSVVVYRSMVIKLLRDIRERGNIPIIVGGPGFYLKSLLFPPHDYEQRTCFTDAYLSQASAQSLWETLHTVDPERARCIQQHDLYRIRRALDVWYTTGYRPSTYKPKYKNVLGSYHVVYVGRDREDLYTRINRRVHTMFDRGWIDEVEGLVNTPWVPFIERKKLIGYNEILAYIKEGKPLDRHEGMLAKIQTRTRNYARRQIIFWRMLERVLVTHWKKQEKDPVPITSLNLTSGDYTIYIRRLLATHSVFQRDLLHEPKRDDMR